MGPMTMKNFVTDSGIASMHGTYSQAKQLLNAVLRAQDFQPNTKHIPWWMQGLRWLSDRLQLHLHMSSAAWRGLAWWIGAIAGGLLVLAVVWSILGAVRHNQTRVGSLKTQSETREVGFDTAERALAAGQYDVMLHGLMEACLRTAERRGWIRYLAFRTARQYQQQLEQVADPSFRAAYQALVETAEAVLFAGKPLSVAEARKVYGQVRALTLEEPG